MSSAVAAPIAPVPTVRRFEVPALKAVMTSTQLRRIAAPAGRLAMRTRAAASEKVISASATLGAPAAPAW